MSPPTAVEILSDDDEEDGFSSPFPALQAKKQRTDSESNPTVLLVVDDDQTPQKLQKTVTPSFVAETPILGSSSSGVSIVKCTKVVSAAQLRASTSEDKFSGVGGLICLESDNESESGSQRGNWKEYGKTEFVNKDPELSTRILKSACSLGDLNLIQMSRESSPRPAYVEDDTDQIHNQPDKETVGLEQLCNVKKKKSQSEVDTEKKKKMTEAAVKKNVAKQERKRLMEEKKLKKEQEKLQKAALKAEAAEMKKLEKEKQKWEKGKFALKSIVAEIDIKVIELGSVGGHLLTRLSEKGLTFRIASNPLERSILWTINVPDELSQLSSKATEIPYILFVYEADDFCNLTVNDSIMGHLSTVRRRYPSYTICYLTNRLMAYINKREQELYKNPALGKSWRRPPVEEVLSKFATHFDGVHSRQCVDEAELAEHIVGLTCSLASCQFRKKLTRLSVNANDLPKDCVDRNFIKSSIWLKALVAIPKVQPRFAVAIAKQYPTMKSLLSVYMDPNKSVHEKEFLLKDLKIEGLLGENRRLGEVCSKRLYRILMAQSGSIKTDEVEEGADFFTSQSS